MTLVVVVVVAIGAHAASFGFVVVIVFNDVGDANALTIFASRR